MAYTPTGTYNDAVLTDADKAKIKALQAQYTSASASGNATAANAAHTTAEALRAAYGYSGGADGSAYAPVPTLPSASSQASDINRLYDAATASNAQALKSAYDTNMLSVDKTAAEIPATYQTAKNTTAASSEQNLAAWNEYAAASGLNSGTSGQGFLSNRNTLQNNLSSLDAAQATALSNVKQQRLELQTKYQNDVAQAIADGDLARAQALYEEAVRVDESVVSTALNQADADYRASQAAYSANTAAAETSAANLLTQAETLAAYGDFSGYKAIGYNDAQIANMKAAYDAAMAAQTAKNGASGKSGAGTSDTVYVSGLGYVTQQELYKLVESDQAVSFDDGYVYTGGSGSNGTEEPAATTAPSSAYNSIISGLDAKFAGGDYDGITNSLNMALGNGQITEAEYASLMKRYGWN